MRSVDDAWPRSSLRRSRFERSQEAGGGRRSGKVTIPLLVKADTVNAKGGR